MMTQKEDRTKREIAFVDWWYKEHTSVPTYTDAITWADSYPNLSEEEQVGMGGLGMMWQKQALIKKACDFLVHNMTDSTYLGANTLLPLHKADFIEQFKKAMEE